MKHAVRNTAGAWTGAVYDQVTPAILRHHADHDEDLLPVAAIHQDASGSWSATELAQSERAATLAVTRFQARAALMQAGLLGAVEGAVAGSSDPFIQLAWAESVEFPRASPTIAALAAAVGLSDAEVDQLFITASTITA